MDIKEEIQEDMKRAEQALQSAERNMEENDVLTSANRLFVACESAVCAFLKHQYGNSSVSRERILTRLREIDERMRKTYDDSYDLRVQADYGKKSRHFPLTKENIITLRREVVEVIEKVRTTISHKEKKINQEKDQP